MQTTASKYFIRSYQSLEFLHGGVGYSDMEKILQKTGYLPLDLPEKAGFLLPLKRWLVMKKLVQRVQAGSTVVCILPAYPRMHRIMIRKMAARGVKLVFILADIDGLKTQNQEILRKEIQLMGEGRHFIVHTPGMEAWLRGLFPDAGIQQLGPFDFLASPAVKTRQISHDICFAGNLQKSEFLKYLPGLPDLRFHLYGNGLPEFLELPGNCIYHGTYPPHQMPEKIEGSFGLVWDGDSISGAGGSLGEYMKYIFHHKVSLYILAGMPLIAPAFAGSAAYIREKKIGWLVNSLEEIPSLIQKISGEAYAEAVGNMRQLAEGISTGRHLQQALETISSEVYRPG